MSPYPEDKYGNPIYSKPYKEVVKNSKILTNNGYSESFNKPNLFYKKIPVGIFFADMRSSEVIPIWEDTRPLFYWQFNKEIPMWKRRRLIKKELIYLFKNGCKCRLSFYAPFRTEELEQISGYIDETEGIFEWPEGYCLYCDKDHQSDNVFCSEECHQKYIDSFKKECKVCKRKLEYDQEIGHHLNYADDITIIVCRTCHAKIHFSEEPEYTEFKHNDSKFKQEKKYKLVQCNNKCKGKTRVLISEYDKDKKYYCYKCKKSNSRRDGLFWEN